MPVRSQFLNNALRGLRYRNYRLFFTGQVISLLGTWMQNLAMGWLVYRLTNSALALGVVGFSSQICSFFIAPFAGVWADRLDRRPLIIATQALAMVQAFILSYLTISGAVRVWQIVALSVFLGLVSAFDMPVRHSFTADMIENKEDLGNVIALNSVIFNIARFIGPMAAGAVIALWGEGVCFLLNGFSYMAVIGALAMMRIPPRQLPGPASGGVLESLKKGFRHTFSSVPIRRVILLMSLISLVAAPYTVLMPMFVRDVLKGDSRTMGYLMGAAGIGALSGAFFMAARRSITGIGSRIAASVVCSGLGMMMCSFARSLWLALAMMPLVGFGLMVHMSASNTFIQTFADEDKRGRVIGFFMLAFIGLGPFGSLLFGGLASRLGAPATMFLAGAGCLAGASVFAPSVRLIDRAAFKRSVNGG